MSIRAIDLFCGAGGGSRGAQNAGAKIIAGFDMWQPAVQTYKANFPEARVFDMDIRGLSPQDIRSEIGEINLILASPECTNHSVAKGAAARDEAIDNQKKIRDCRRFLEVGVDKKTERCDPNG